MNSIHNELKNIKIKVKTTQNCMASLKYDPSTQEAETGGAKV